ncbi:MAG: thioesterase family protein [Cryobacterium sp.]|nr:thioesterase family protein [Cryobacterium sp.]
MFVRRRKPTGASPLAVSRSSFRVLPTDVDALGHMNNGRFLSIADLGRFELLQQAGLYGPMRKRGWYPVVVASTISYRKSLDLWKKYDLESRLVGIDDRAVYVEQRFTVDGEIYAQMVIRGRFLQERGGLVPMGELIQFFGIDRDDVVMPEWLLRWSRDVALPSTKSPAPSIWE